MAVLSLPETLHLTRWMEVNHDRLVTERVSRRNACEQASKAVGKIPTEGRVTDIARALGWDDWPVKGGPGGNPFYKYQKLSRIIRSMYVDLGGDDARLLHELDEMIGDSHESVEPSANGS